jgi:hypothetical protein
MSCWGSNNFRVALLGAALVFFLPVKTLSAHEIMVTNHVSIPGGAKWNPTFWFGNVDDPVPPSDYLPKDHNRVKKWYVRNSAHNLTFYIFGIADKNFHRSGKYPDQVFNPHGGWNWTVCKYKTMRLPFLSYQRHSFAFYLGWRERGNFGVKFSL